MVFDVDQLALQQLPVCVRIFCISMFLTWTARYQPSRIICAMPRASLRSVLLRIVESETRMARFHDNDRNPGRLQFAI
jgi:hypothetical protein